MTGMKGYNMHNRKWIGDKLWLLVNEPTVRLKQVFPDMTSSNITNKRKMYKQRIREGTEGNPIRPEWYKSTMSPHEIRQKLDNVDINNVDLIISEHDRAYLHKVLDDTIQKANIDPSSVKGFKVTSGSHQGYIKNTEGEIEYTQPLERKGITFIAEARDFKPDWPIVSRVESIKAPKVNISKSKFKTCVILPDLQIPYHDEQAISVALQIVSDVKPDTVVLLGDSLDLPEWSRFEQRPEFARSTQAAINTLHQLLATLRTTLPNAEIVVLAGNHEKRLEAKILNNAVASYGLKRADQLDHWPVMSVPYLTAMDSLNVKYLDGYPANKFWINQRLQVRHGHLVRSSGSTAKAVSDDERVSTIFGHVHRIEMQYKTVNVYEGARTNFAFTPGCLCKIDGSVPSTKSGYDTDGTSLVNYENWQQGIAVVNYQVGDAPFSLEPVFINTLDDYSTSYRGKVYKP
jgi:predicted phosphodiesterase